MDDQQIKELMDKIDQLIKTLKDQGKFNYVNIEHADIQGPLVDKLDYNFDKLDVKEVSGALNLGTTFGVQVGEKKKKNESSGGPSSQQKKSKQGGGTSSTTEKKKQTPSQSSSETSTPKKKTQHSGSQGSGSHSQSREQRVNQKRPTSISRKKEKDEIAVKPPINRKKDQAQTRKSEPELASKNNSDQGKFKLSFRRRGSKETELEATTTVAEVTSEPKNKEEKTAPTNKESINTYKKTKRKSKKETILENTKSENTEQAETKSPNVNESVKETQEEVKTPNPFSSTKKGFSVKLR